MACVQAAKCYDAEVDAETMEKAMKGIGTDEKAIINLLSARSASQRVKIAESYKSLYGKDMKKELHGELSGHFRQAVLWSFYDQAHVNASALFKAIDRPGTDERILVDVLCTATNSEIIAIKAAYQEILAEMGKNVNKRNLEKDIEGDTSGDFRRVLIALVQAQRDDAKGDDELARADALALYGGGEKKLGTDEALFTRIFCTRSFAHLERVDQIYQEDYGHSLEKAISKETSGDYKDALTSIIKTAKSRKRTIAEMLYDSMAGAGTRDDRLVRIIIAHSETNLKNIETIFNETYKKSLVKMIEGDTTGDYRRYLLAILKAN